MSAVQSLPLRSALHKQVALSLWLQRMNRTTGPVFRLPILLCASSGARGRRGERLGINGAEGAEGDGEEEEEEDKIDPWPPAIACAACMW